MKHRRRLCVAPLESRLAPALATWDGGGANNHWTTAANWAGDVAPNPGDDLAFPASAAQLTNINDFAAGTAFGQIGISGQGYQIAGNRINLSGGLNMVVPGSGAAPLQLSFPVTLTANQSFVSNFNAPYVFAGAIDLNGFNLVFNASVAPVTVSGAIGGTGGISTTGGANLILEGMNTYSGATLVTDGLLEVRGAVPGAIVVSGFGFLGGTGVVGPATISTATSAGFLQPGTRQSSSGLTNPGTLTTGNLSLGVPGQTLFAITEAGASQVNVHGTVQLGGTLFINFNNSSSPVHTGDVFTLIQNDGTDPVAGTFQNIPEGTIVTQGPIPLRISYHGGDGNDVTVSAVVQTGFAVGAGAGGFPLVFVYTADGIFIRGFFAYTGNFQGGVHVATGDVTGDGVPDIVTAPGAGGGPVVRVWDGGSGAMIREFNAYDPSFRGSVSVALSRINQDFPNDIITGAGPGGGPHVQVFDGATGAVVSSFFAYDANFRGGVSVAGTHSITTHFGFVPGSVITGAGPGGAPHVRTFNGMSAMPLTSFFAYDLNFRGGVNVAVGNVFRSNDIITAPASNGSPVVRVFAFGSNGGATVAPAEREFLAYAANFLGGVTLAVPPLAFAFPESLLTGAGPGGGPHVVQWSVANPTPIIERSFFAFDPSFTGGVFVG
jgi:autotransporter-associated beta strand protein